MKGGIKMGKSKARCNFAPIDMFGSPVEFNINGEGSYKTIVGCIWTILLALLMIGATVYYLVIYSDKTNVTLSSQSIQGSESPMMNFTEKGLFVVLMFQEGEMFYTPPQIESLFNIQSAHFTYTSTNDASTNVRTLRNTGPKVSQVKLSPCRSANVSGTIDGKAILGKTGRALSDFGYCAITKDGSFYVQGDDDSDSYSYIDIKVFPCQGPFSSTTPIPKGSCAIPNVNNGNLDASGEEKTRTKLRNIKIYMMLIDTAINATNYDDPFVYIMNGNYHYVPTMNQEKSIDFIFKTVTVSTDKGILFSDVEEKESYSIGEVIYDSKDRGPSDQQTFFTPQGPTKLPLPYATFRIRAGAEKVTYTRMYLMILDVIGLVGGVSQVFTVAVIVLYSWYNSIRMEQEMINRTILNINEGERPLEDWETDIMFSFGEIFRFKYCSMCAKKNKKYANYNKCTDLMDEKTDITKIIRAVADIQTIKEALLSASQNKLLQYAAINSIFEEESKETDDSISVSDAINSLKSKSHGVPKDIDTRINEYLLKRLPADIVNKASVAKSADWDLPATNQIEMMDPSPNRIAPSGSNIRHVNGTATNQASERGSKHVPKVIVAQERLNDDFDKL